MAYNNAFIRKDGSETHQGSALLPLEPGWSQLPLGVALPLTVDGCTQIQPKRSEQVHHQRPQPQFLLENLTSSLKSGSHGSPSRLDTFHRPKFLNQEAPRTRSKLKYRVALTSRMALKTRVVLRSCKGLKARSTLKCRMALKSCMALKYCVMLKSRIAWQSRVALKSHLQLETLRILKAMKMLKQKLNSFAHEFQQDNRWLCWLWCFRVDGCVRVCLCACVCVCMCHYEEKMPVEWQASHAGRMARMTPGTSVFSSK